MITFGLNSLENGNVVYGNRSDVCELCLVEAMKDAKEAYETGKRNRIASRSVIREELAGKQAGKPLFKAPTSSSEPVFICKDHMKKLVEKMESMPESTL